MSEHAKDTLDGRALAGALEALRPERAAFEQGVRRRIAEGEERERERAAEIERSPFLHAAAGLLPATLLPKGIAPATLAAWSPRSLLLLVVWPALTLALMLFPLVLAFHSLGGEVSRTSDQRRAAVRSWWRAHRRGAVITLFILALLFLLEPAGGAVALLLVSTGVLAVLLARLRLVGFEDRAHVGRSCAYFLALLLLLMPWNLLGDKLLFDGSIVVGCGALLALGTLVCAYLALAAVHKSPWSWLVRSTAAEVGLGFLVVFLGGFLVLTVVVPLVSRASMHVLLQHDEPRDRLQVQLEQRLLRSEPRHWTLAADIDDWLREVERSPDLSRVRELWSEQLDSGEPLTGAFLVAGLRLRLAGKDEIVARLPAGLLDQERERDGPLLEPILRESPVTLLLVLEAAREPALLEWMQERLRFSILSSGPTQASPLRRAADVVWLLEELEPGSSAKVREVALSLLKAYWNSAGYFEAARLRASGSGVSMIADTHAAVELMATFGVPGDVDLRALERRLLERARPPLLPWTRSTGEHVEALLALDKLRTHLCPQRRLPRPLDLALLLACGLLSALCVTATLRAPRAVA